MTSLTPGKTNLGAHVASNSNRDVVRNWFFAFLVIDVAAIGVCAFVLSQNGVI